MSKTGRVSSGVSDTALLTPIEPADIEASMAMIREYAKPYRELLTRSEQGRHLERMLTGLTSNLERKSVEPIAVMHGIPRRLLQRFVGENGWDHDPLMRHQWEEVTAEIGVDDGAVIVDGSATPKKGDETVGVARQWCGRLGKVDNCVVGVYAAYVGACELSTLVASRLFLPRDWTDDQVRREKAYVPDTVKYRTQAQIAGDLVASLTHGLRFEWVLGDDEFGRAQHFRDRVAALEKSYVLDVPSNTVVRKVTKMGWVKDKNWSVQRIAKRRANENWQHFAVRDGEKGPVEVRAFSEPVATRRDGGRWVAETLLVIETADATQRWYCLAHTEHDVPLVELVRQAGRRHRIEEVFEECKGEVGLDHFEVRAWHGWHHHMTLSQLAHWFLVREKRRLGEKSTRHHGESDPNGARSNVCSAMDSDESGRLHQLSPGAQLQGEVCSIRGSRTPAAAAFTLGIDSLPRPVLYAAQ